MGLASAFKVTGLPSDKFWQQFCFSVFVLCGMFLSYNLHEM
jgi:hypothetical protein